MSGSEADDLEIIDEIVELNEPAEDDLEIIGRNVEQSEPNNETEEASGNQDAAETPETDKKEVKVKRARNPQPKLDVERLKGPRGLKILDKVFKDVKFKGRGHEEEDLCVLMKNYEYWCHRFFPMFPFDACLERMERLGTQKPLQTYIKRIRMDLMLDDEIVQQDEVVEQQGEVVNEEVDDNDVFDTLLPRQTQSQPQPTNSGSTGLSEDQLERIRINRERAQRLRQQMLIRNQTSSESLTQTASESLTQTSENNAENIIPVASSQSSSICNALKNIDFTENMSVDLDTNQASSQNSIEGESLCFQTTAMVHNTNAVSETIASPEMMSVEYASSNLLSDTSIASETIASQQSNGTSFDHFDDIQTMASQESSIIGANNREISLKNPTSQESVENMSVDYASQDVDENTPSMPEQTNSQNSIDFSIETSQERTRMHQKQTEGGWCK